MGAKLSTEQRQAVERRECSLSAIYNNNRKSVKAPTVDLKSTKEIEEFDLMKEIEQQVAAGMARLFAQLGIQKRHPVHGQSDPIL